MGEEEFELAGQSLNPRRIKYLDLEELHKLYGHATVDIPNTSHLSDVHGDIQQILEYSRDYGLDVLADHGIEMNEPDIRYVPFIEGARWNEGTVEIGQDGRGEHPYNLGTEVTHEMLHGYVRSVLGVSEYTPREEALMQVWNLYHDDVIGYDAEDRITDVREDYEDGEGYERLNAVRDRYNEHPSMTEEFGEEIFEYADHFMALYDELEGSRENRMKAVLEYGMLAIAANANSDEE